MGKREDDGFLRKVIWFLIGATIVSTGGWIWTVAVTQTQVKANTEAVKKIQKLQETMTKINIGVVTLVENSKIRNELMKQYASKQDYIFGEQKRRTSTINRSNSHMKNWRIHK